MKRIVIDIYGADNGAQPILEGTAKMLAAHPEIGAVLVGSEKLIRASLPSALLKGRVKIIDTEDFIAAAEHASVIFGGRNESSMALALKALKEDDDCIGMLSAGVTGALMIGSIFRLGLIGDLKCPALSSSLPTVAGSWVCLVDCGANVNCSAKDLARFALMGNAYAQIIYQKESPRVALLSVGREDTKGNNLTLEAFGLINALPINFIGNAEGNDLITGYADVMVADGFSGNIILKSNEASGKVAIKLVEDALAGCAVTEKAAYEKILEKLNYLFELNARGGATFLGTKKPVIKMHGCAVPETVCACAEQLLMLDNADFTRKLETALLTPKM